MYAVPGFAQEYRVGTRVLGAAGVAMLMAAVHLDNKEADVLFIARIYLPQRLSLIPLFFP